MSVVFNHLFYSINEQLYTGLGFLFVFDNKKDHLLSVFGSTGFLKIPKHDHHALKHKISQ